MLAQRAWSRRGILDAGQFVADSAHPALPNQPLAAAIQDGSGRVSGWWPVAYALRRINDPRAILLLRQLAATPGRYTRAFAARGLGALKDTASVPLLKTMLERASDGKGK